MNTLKAIVENFSSVKVAVVGDIGIDENIIGAPHGFSSDAPIPVYTSLSHQMILGCAGNTIANIHSLAGCVVPISFIGDSSACKYVREFMLDNKITTEGLLQDYSRPVHKHLRLYVQRPHSPKQQAIRFDNPILAPISPEQENQILNVVSDHMRQLDAVIVVDYSKGVVTPRVISEISKAANSCGKISAGDSRYQIGCFQNYTVITPNDQEAIAEIRHCAPAEVTADDVSNYLNVKDAGVTLLQELDLKNLVITRGENGMSIFRENTIKEIPTVVKEVVDPIGAGDTTIAAIVLSLCSGANMAQAATIASHAASIVVGKSGTATVSQNELLRSITAG